MGSIARQSQAQRFLDEFSGEANKLVDLPADSVWVLEDQSVGYDENWCEVRHFITLRNVVTNEKIECDTGRFVLSSDASADDVLEVLTAVDVNEKDAKKRLVKCGMFDEFVG